MLITGILGFLLQRINLSPFTKDYRVLKDILITIIFFKLFTSLHCKK